jgi:predicted DNA-binding protein
VFEAEDNRPRGAVFLAFSGVLQWERPMDRDARGRKSLWFVTRRTRAWCPAPALPALTERLARVRGHTVGVPVAMQGEGGNMDFSERLDALQQHVAATRAAVQGAVTESREQLEKRIDQAQVDLDQAVKNAHERVEQADAGVHSKWAEMRADAAAKREDVRSKINKRTRQLDAKVAASDADWAEADAADALDFAEWALDTAQLAMLDAIDARTHANELAKAASS